VERNRGPALVRLIRQAKVESSIEQLLLYAELARAFAPGKRLRLELVVLTKTKQVALERHVWAVDPSHAARTKPVVERVWNAIDAEHYYPAPSPLSSGGAACAKKAANRRAPRSTKCWPLCLA